MFGHLDLLLRSRRIQACVALAALSILVVAVAAYAPLLSVAAKLVIISVIMLGAALLMSIIVARMIGLAIELPPPQAPSSSRLAHLATQLQASDINVARLAAKLERVEAGSRSEAAAVLDQIAHRLNALENALAALERDGQADELKGVLGQFKAGIGSIGDRLAKLENADRSMSRLEARLQLIEDQLASHAQNVERLTRRNA
ncbi:MAG: hypothetical protein M0D54_17945 [Hyphomonadaceae bacterium JAD_PAG50586_4]|nr:MAG: hypothetical protein M0D54_17945 [Hyphomonadaceae bacterium JAD_PAG50586_4]